MTNNIVSFWDKLGPEVNHEEILMQNILSQILAQMFLNGAKSIITITDIYYQGNTK